MLHRRGKYDQCQWCSPPPKENRVLHRIFEWNQRKRLLSYYSLMAAFWRYPWDNLLKYCLHFHEIWCCNPLNISFFAVVEVYQDLLITKWPRENGSFLSKKKYSGWKTRRNFCLFGARKDGRQPIIFCQLINFHVICSLTHWIHIERLFSANKVHSPRRYTSTCNKFGSVYRKRNYSSLSNSVIAFCHCLAS